MTVSKWTHAGTILKMNALNYPDKPGCEDLDKSFTFRELNERTCRLAHAIAKSGLEYQDRFAIISYNRAEWMEIYGSCGKRGHVMVPIMFRLAPPEIEYIVNHSDSKAIIVEEPFVEIIDKIRHKFINIPKENFIYLGKGSAPEGYIHYEEFLADASPDEPDSTVDAADMWTIMYTSGTTGKPKGVVRTHEAILSHYYNGNIIHGVVPTDKALFVMPMCHVNSLHYSFAYSLVTAPVMIYNRAHFDPKELLQTISEYNITFTSLVPTHYIMMLALPDEIKQKYDVSCIRQLLVSSAPARKDLKLAIMDFFKNAKLFESYGSTEAGLVTTLRPEDQLKKLGSIGKEIYGTDRIKILDENGNEVPDGEVGELYSRTPSVFKEYWKDPEKTREVFKGEWFSAGDMCRRDEDGYYYLVDRKSNMIITGGENVYPSEVENVIGYHEAVKDIAVIGIPDKKWGESVKAVVILHNKYEPSDDLAEDIIDFCKDKIAGYKRPKSVDFIKEEDMPRTGSGKIMHRILRERYGTWSD